MLRDLWGPMACRASCAVTFRQPYPTQSVLEVVLHKSIPTQIREHILYISDSGMALAGHGFGHFRGKIVSVVPSSVSGEDHYGDLAWCPYSSCCRVQGAGRRVQGSESAGYCVDTFVVTMYGVLDLLLLLRYYSQA